MHTQEKQKRKKNHKHSRTPRYSRDPEIRDTSERAQRGGHCGEWKANHNNLGISNLCRNENNNNNKRSIEMP